MRGFSVALRVHRMGWCVRDIMPGEQGLKWYVHPIVAPRFGNMSIVLSCGAAGLKCRCRCPKSATDLFGLKRF